MMYMNRAAYSAAGLNDQGCMRRLVLKCSPDQVERLAQPSVNLAHDKSPPEMTCIIIKIERFLQQLTGRQREA